jgi:hypothetical protein
LNRALFEPELNFHAGKLVKIHGEYPENDMSFMTELNLSFKTRGRQYWQQARQFPSMGLSVTYSTYGNEDVLGYSIGLVPTLRAEWEKKKMILAVRGGIGLSWFSDPFDPIDNPENIAIGTRITAMATGWAGVLVPLSEDLRINFGISATHCSDGHLGVPNVGLNVLAGSAGIAFTPHSVDRTKREEIPVLNPLNKKKKWNFQLSAILGLHEFQGTTRPIGGPLYPVYGATLCAIRNAQENGGILFGVNTYYYTSFHDYILLEELFPADDATSSSYNIVVFSGYEWYFGRFSLYIQIGVNLYAPFYHEFAKTWDLPQKGPLNEWTSQKLGYKYHFLDRKIFVTTAIKTNGGTADFFECSIGVNL